MIQRRNTTILTHCTHCISSYVVLVTRERIGGSFPLLKSNTNIFKSVYQLLFYDYLWPVGGSDRLRIGFSCLAINVMCVEVCVCMYVCACSNLKAAAGSSTMFYSFESHQLMEKGGAHMSTCTSCVFVRACVCAIASFQALPFWLAAQIQ